MSVSPCLALMSSILATFVFFVGVQTTTGAPTTTEAPSESLTTITDMPVTTTEAVSVDNDTTSEVVSTGEQAPTTEAPS